MRGNSSPQIFDLIAAKFIANLPKQELTQQRIGFHFERAYFYYIDTQQLKLMNSKQKLQFCKQLLRVVSCPQLPKINASQISQLIQQNYCSVPVNGIILLNMKQTHTLLVQSFGVMRLGFPKGKINQGETPQHCAVRQVYQQIGLKLQIDVNNYVQVQVLAKIGGKTFSKYCKFFIHKIQQSCIVPRKSKAQGNRQNGVRQIIHSMTQIKSIGWYKLNQEIPKLIDQGLLNSASKLAYYQFIKKNKKNLNYKEKKQMNPLQDFKGFDKSFNKIFLG